MSEDLVSLFADCVVDLSNSETQQLMVSVDRPVVRMFICEFDTVRWETRIADGRGLELKVFGPGTLRRAYAFADALSLVEYQVQYEHQLLSNGYGLLPLSERRAGYDRRRRPRAVEDRRH